MDAEVNELKDKLLPYINGDEYKNKSESLLLHVFASSFPTTPFGASSDPAKIGIMYVRDNLNPNQPLGDQVRSIRMRDSNLMFPIPMSTGSIRHRFGRNCDNFGHLAPQRNGPPFVQ